MPGMIKVGFTTKQVEERVAQLGGTGIPTPFTIGAQFYVTNPKKTEKKVHNALKKFRTNDQREFFQGELSAFLKACFPIIVEAIPDQIGGAVELSQATEPLLSEISIQIILSLIPGRKYGCSMYEFKNDRELPYHPLIIERELEALRSAGYVEFRKDRKGRWESTVYWSITSKGIKMLFDTGVLKEDDLEKYT